MQQNTSHNGTSPPKLQLLLKLIMAIPRKGQNTKAARLEICMLKYITRKEWKAVLNIIFKMKEFQNVLPWAVQSAINREFELYCPRTF